MRGFKSLGLGGEETKDFPNLVKQPPVVPKGMIAEVAERIDYRGRVFMPLDEEGAREAIRLLLEEGAEVLAVCLLWSFRNDAHEGRIAELAEELCPGTPVTLSSEILPRIGEYARSVTTALNAGLGPVVRRALSGLEERLSAHGFEREPLFMQSSGGLAPLAEVYAKAASTVMSGPVGGVVAYRSLGELMEEANIIATDMGGTSFDARLVVGGKPLMSNATRIERDSIALPSVDVRTIGAGSGNIASVEDGMLRVGPQSAGASWVRPAMAGAESSRRPPMPTSCSVTSTRRISRAAGSG